MNFVICDLNISSAIKVMHLNDFQNSSFCNEEEYAWIWCQTWEARSWCLVQAYQVQAWRDRANHPAILASVSPFISQKENNCFPRLWRTIWMVPSIALRYIPYFPLPPITAFTHNRNLCFFLIVGIFSTSASPDRIKASLYPTPSYHRLLTETQLPPPLLHLPHSPFLLWYVQASYINILMFKLAQWLFYK